MSIHKTLKDFVEGMKAGVPLVAMTSGIAIAIAAMIMPLNGSKSLTNVEAFYDIVTQRQVEKLAIDQAALRRIIYAQSTSPTSTPDRQLSALQEQFRRLEERQGAIERALDINSTKALEIAILRKDLESLRDSNAQANLYLKDSIERVYDLSKWLLGALTLGVLGSAFSFFIGPWSKRTAPPQVS